MERNTLSTLMTWKLLTKTPRSEFELMSHHLESEICVGDNRENKSPLHDAVLYGEPGNIPQLIKNGSNVEIRTGLNKETPIHCAAKLGKLECLKCLSNYGGSLTTKDGSEEGNSPIHLAVIHGHEEVTRWLIDNGVSVDTVNKKGITPLVYATWYGYTNLVQIIAKKGANVNCRTSCFNNATPLHLAVSSDKQDVVRTLLEFGASPELFCSCNQTPVHWATAYGNLQSLKIMETYGAKLSVRTNDNCGYQPIHLAAGGGHVTLVEWFLDNGIAVDCPNNFGFTPLHLAAVKGQTETANFLLKRGAQVNMYINSEHSTFLHVAASSGNLSIMQTVLDLGADVEAQDCYKYTPAHYATKNDHVHCLKRLRNFEEDKKVRNETNSFEPLIITAAKYDSEDAALWLLECGESIEVRCKDGMTPLHHATICDSRNVAFLLIREGADVNSKDNNLLSPLHYAVLKKSIDIGILLLAWKADLQAETKEYFNPLHLAAKGDELDFLKIMLSHGGSILAPTANNKCDYPIHIAASYGSDNVLQWLIDSGISVNVTKAVGCTPLLNVAGQRIL
ncbi:hypothetical protein B7P43_G06700 [Cryptotermes secundus]|uniref:Uncharacterized protein n=1 Tax=Cryptotermes secundus TaxID=105785 RepID=A0A2J7Q3H2_9NEOP|nr:putative ankyrin repeat protein RF_0381 [Cryptotermes secundus]PNF23134.1 hypothetical protein B7P43_G06700 [Cryptotermes secundus]